MAFQGRVSSVFDMAAGALHLIKRPEWIAPWIAFVVGVHFFALAALVTAYLLAAILLARASGIAPSAVTAVGVGGFLLVFALYSRTNALL